MTNKIICDYCDEEATFHFEWKFYKTNHPPMDSVGLGNIGLYDLCEKHKDEIYNIIRKNKKEINKK